MPHRAHNETIIPREKWFWAGLALLLVLAGWLYLRGYNASLPFFAHGDEPQHVIAAQHIIDFGHESGVHDQYPPGTKTLAYLLQKHIKPVDAHHGATLPALRLITILAWMLVVVLIAMLGRLILQPLTGLMAAGIWIVNPWVVERARWLLPDAYLTLFTLLAIWLALEGARHWRRRLSTTAVYSIMLATIFKTQALFVTPLIVFLPLLRLVAPSPTDATGAAARREALEQVAWNCARMGVFLFWLLLISPALEMDRIVYFTMSFDSIALPSFESAWASLRNVLQTFQQDDHWLPSAALSLLLWRYRRRVNWLALSVIVLAALAWLSGMSMFNVQSRRHFFAVGAIVSLLYACGLTGLLYALQETFADLQKPALTPRVRQLLVSGLFLVVLAISLLPRYRQSDNLAHYFTLHDRRVDLMQYMDTSLEPGKFVTNRVEKRTISRLGWSGYLGLEWGNHKTFNRAWGGYDGVHDFPVSQTVFDLHKKPLEEWRAYDAEYAIMPHWRMLDDPDIYFPDDTVLLKTYPVSDDFRGPDMVVLRLYPMQITATGQLGGIHLKGYDISASTAQAGDDIILRHYWQAESAPETALHVFNHLLDADGQIAAQVDGIPLYDSRRDTTSWDDADEILLGRNFILRLPADLPPGDYPLISGFYDPQNGARLMSASGADHIPITEIVISAATPAE